MIPYGAPPTSFSGTQELLSFPSIAWSQHRIGKKEPHLGKCQTWKCTTEMSIKKEPDALSFVCAQ